MSFKRREGVFRAFRPEDEGKYLNDPRRVPLKFDGLSFELFKKNFTGSLTGSESKIHRFDQATEVISVEVTSSYYKFLLRISG